MRHPKIVGVCLIAAAAAFTLTAGDSWNKDYKNWTVEDVQRMLTNSPWAAKTYVTMESNGMQSGNGSGYPNSGGYPSGGGMGGGGMGGGGMGRMGGMGGGMGGMGGGGMGRGRGGQGANTIKSDVVVRWDSSMPVKEALLRQQFGANLPNPGDANYTLDKEEKDYVISVVGLRTPTRSMRIDDQSSDPDESSMQTSHMKNVLVASTQLLLKNKPAINPEDVKITQQNDGTNVAQFTFPRSSPIDLDDKEVTFITQTGQMKIERKFKLKEMVYNGKLSL